MLNLDIIIATYNRRDLLARALESILRAQVSAQAQLGVVVVDNNSTDDTRTSVDGFGERFAARFTRGLRYVHEARPGKSHALNAGLARASSELVGMIDDDEEIDGMWFEETARAFSDPTLDYITGPYYPRWSMEPPAWLPKRPSSVIGWVDGGHEVRTFGEDYDGVLMGGNAVVRLALLREIGGYDASLGPTADRRLLSCEDEDVHKRLVAAGARGQYRPGLVIHHYIPPERLVKRYHRRWSFWHGVSSGVLDRDSHHPVPYALGLPRYRLGRIARGAVDYLPGLLGVGPLRHGHDRFAAWMDAIDAAGYWYGKFRFRAQPRGDSRAAGAHPIAVSSGDLESGTSNNEAISAH